MNRDLAAGAVGGTLFLVAACLAPASPEPPARARIRAAVLAMAHGVRSADEACARIAEARSDAPLADRCAGAQRTARAALIAAEVALDTATETSAGCAARPAVGALTELVDAVRAGEGRAPPAVDDAAAMVLVLERLAPCRDDAGAP